MSSPNANDPDSTTKHTKHTKRNQTNPPDDGTNSSLDEEPLLQRIHKSITFNFRDPVSSFVGRCESLEQLRNFHQCDNKQCTVMISGLDGIGKTQLARVYAKENFDYYGSNIIWLDCRNQLSFANSLEILAQNVGVLASAEDGKEKRSLESVIKDVHYYFKDTRCLFVLDNVEQHKRIDTFLQTHSSNIDILLTSKAKIWENAAVEVLQLKEFSVEEAETLVANMMKNEEIKEINQLIEIVDRVPLALAIATSYIKKQNELLAECSSECYTIHDYLKSYQKFSEKLKSDSIFIAVDISFAKITSGTEDVYKAALKLIQYLAYFAPNDINIKWFKNAFEGTILSEAVGLLRGYCLVEAGNGVIGIHVPVQEAIRIKMKGENEENVLSECIEIVKTLDERKELTHIVSVLMYASECTSIISRFNQSNYDILGLALFNNCQFGNIDIIKSLIEKGAEFNYTEWGRSAIHAAAEGGNLEILEYLIQIGLGFELLDDFGNTPLQLACKSESLETVKYLISKKANTDCTNKLDRNLLHSATEGGNIDIMDYLIKFGMGLESLDKTGCTPLRVACRSGTLELVKYLISEGCNINCVDNDGRTLLHVAAVSNNIDNTKIINYLLQLGLGMETLDNYKTTPLQLACDFGTLDSVKYFISKGANINCTDTYNRTLLHSAVEDTYEEKMEYLIKIGMDIEALDAEGYTPLHLACSIGTYESVKYLISKGAKTMCINKHGHDIMHSAAVGEHLETLKHLIEMGMDMESLDNDRKTPLQHACIFGTLDSIKFLVSKGANIKIRNKFGRNLVHAATEKGRIDVIAYLMELGVDIEEKTIDGSTCFHYACAAGNLESVKYFVSRGANVKCTDNHGRCVLHASAENVNVPIVGYLLELGMDIEILDELGKTALQYACEFGGLETVKFFVSKGANVNTTDTIDRTLLHLAASGGKLDIMDYLIEIGLDMEVLNIDGSTSLHIACRLGTLESVKHLISKGANTSCKNTLGRNMLHAAAEGSKVLISDYLIETGMSIEALDHADYTPLEIACCFGNLEMVKFLLGKEDDQSLETLDMLADLGNRLNNTEVYEHLKKLLFDNYSYIPE